jgi:hypothetical protein
MVSTILPLTTKVLPSTRKFDEEFPEAELLYCGLGKRTWSHFFGISWYKLLVYPIVIEEWFVPAWLAPIRDQRRAVNGRFLGRICAKEKDIESDSGYFGQCNLFIKIFGLDAIINRDFACSLRGHQTQNTIDHINGIGAPA